MSAIQARLRAACQSTQQTVKAELGKKKKSQVFFPLLETASPEQVLESLFKHLMKLMILLEFIVTEFVTAAGHSASSVNSDF